MLNNERRRQNNYLRRKFKPMTVNTIIDALLEKYYYYDKLILEDAITEFTENDANKQEHVKSKLLNEELIDIIDKKEKGTEVAISIHGKNLVNAGGYLYFTSDSPPRKPPSEPAFLREYNVSAIRYYIFWPLFALALLETGFILWKLM